MNGFTYNISQHACDQLACQIDQIYTTVKYKIINLQFSAITVNYNYRQHKHFFRHALVSPGEQTSLKHLSVFNNEQLKDN